MICYRCHEPVQGPVCPSCEALQPAPPQADPFVVLGLPRRWHVEVAEVDRRWRDLSRKVHPDRHAGGRALERRFALQWSALVNEARRVLRDPTARAWYLATGLPRPPETHGAALDPAFLQQVFEWQEAAEEGRLDRDEVARARQADLDRLEEVFSAWEAGEGDLEAVPSLLSRMKYYDNLLREP